MPRHLSGLFIIRPPMDLLKKHPYLKRQANDLSLKYISKDQIVCEEDLKLVGESLWRALELGDALEKALGMARPQILPVAFQSDDAEILHLPWECLCHPTLGFLGTHEEMVFSRLVPGLKWAKPFPRHPGL